MLEDASQKIQQALWRNTSLKSLEKHERMYP